MAAMSDSHEPQGESNSGLWIFFNLNTSAFRFCKNSRQLLLPGWLFSNILSPFQCPCNSVLRVEFLWDGNPCRKNPIWKNSHLSQNTFFVIVPGFLHGKCQ